MSRSGPERPAITGVAPRDTLLQLLCNTRVNHLLDPEMWSREFALLSRLQRKVLLLLVHPHDDASRISMLCQTIVEDFAKRLPMSRVEPSSAVSQGTIPARNE